MRPRFQADADVNHISDSAASAREVAIDFQDAHAGGVIGLPDLEVLSMAADAAASWFLITHADVGVVDHLAQIRIGQVELRRSRGNYHRSELAPTSSVKSRVICWLLDTRPPCRSISLNPACSTSTF